MFNITLIVLATMLFVLLSMPNTYVLSNKMVRTTFDDTPGLPTIRGLLIHGGLFFALLSILSYNKSPPKYGENKIDTSIFLTP